MQITKTKLALETVLLGITTAGLYFLLYYFEDTVLGWSNGFKKDGWLFLAPIAIALVFSAAHGAFTGHFWELLGIRAKGVNNEQAVD
ncbi:MAG: hypothetical protein O7B35_01915 [Deltaproteobacteria bacterium]|nr:hypothetical protein [Deltaproteobacteria bacterium]